LKRIENNKEQLQLAIYLLNKRFHTPLDLLKYWSFIGPCQEKHPDIEDYPEK